jgi:putative membrane protein
MMGWYGGGMGWVMIISSVLGLALIALVVWAIVRITAPAQRPDAGSPTSAREILDRRFASGEIDVEAYRTALRELSVPGSGGA